MKIWKIYLALGIAYFSYYIGGSVHSIKTNNRYRAEAIQKADINKNGLLEVSEVLEAYKKIGLSGEQIFNKLNNKSRFSLIQKLCQTEEGKERSLEWILSTFDPEEISGSTFPGGSAYHYEVFRKLVRILVDSDKDGKINLEEAERAYKLAYGKNTIDYLNLHFSGAKNVADELVRFLILPHTNYKDSELERYVKEK